MHINVLSSKTKVLAYIDKAYRSPKVDTVHVAFIEDYHLECLNLIATLLSYQDRPRVTNIYVRYYQKSRIFYISFTLSRIAHKDASFLSVRGTSSEGHRLQQEPQVQVDHL